MTQAPFKLRHAFLWIALVEIVFGFTRGEAAAFGIATIAVLLAASDIRWRRRP